MNIRCPQCQTNFRVNPERIPPGGARARCARCGATFQVQARGAPAPAAAGAGVRRESGPASVRAAAPAPAAVRPTPSAPAAAAATSSATSTTGAASFGVRDPNARAERLARALVSDIVAYHPDRRDRSFADGTLRAEFRDEIMKSWEEYVAQVGLPLAKSTPYFREALNKILAKGESVF